MRAQIGEAVDTAAIIAGYCLGSIATRHIRTGPPAVEG
jgi:hypothetical protein